MQSIKHLKILCLIFTVVLTNPVSVFADDKQLGLTCKDFEWSDVESLVAPHMDPVLHTALVMQGQSSEYKVSAALDYIQRETLPEVIQKILTALDKANC